MSINEREKTFKQSNTEIMGPVLFVPIYNKKAPQPLRDKVAEQCFEEANTEKYLPYLHYQFPV